MYLTVEENPNCEVLEGRVFQERSAAREVVQVLRLRNGQEQWCSIVSLDAEGKPCPALARKVEDSGEGTCYLVYGGAWGLRLKDPLCQDDWSLQDTHQWGEAFLLLPADGTDLRFAA